MIWRLLMLLGATAAARPDAPVAIAPSGVYHGYWNYSTSGRLYAAFSGIRYAKPHDQHTRFQLSEMVDNSNDVYPALTEKPACIQWDVLHGNNYIFGQEDCLFANIYTPNVNGSYPVMVTIPSGFFQFGSSSRYINGPDYFMDTASVVLVSFNYRLGPLGFADFHSEKYPANLGMKDQVTFLRWLQNNVAAFGGDPKRVTLQGTSSGAASAHLHMMSPMSRGLFHASISESGTGLTYWAVGVSSRMNRRLEALSKQAGCFHPIGDEMALCLRNLSAYSIFAAYSRLNFQEELLIFLPTIETGNPVGGRFLSQDPFIVPEEPLPWLTGINSDESGLFEPVLKSHTSELMFDIAQLFYSTLFLTYKDTSSDPALITSKALARYFKPKMPILGGFVEYFMKTWRYSGFWLPLYASLEKHKGPKYSYVFSYMETLPNGSLKHTDHKGVWHSEEYFFLYPKQGRFVRKQNSLEDRRMSEILVNLWVNFATYHNPTPPGSNLTNWPQWNNETKLFFNIGQHCNLTAVSGLNYDEYLFWKKLPWRNKLHETYK